MLTPSGLQCGGPKKSLLSHLPSLHACKGSLVFALRCSQIKAGAITTLGAGYQATQDRQSQMRQQKKKILFCTKEEENEIEIKLKKKKEKNASKIRSNEFFIIFQCKFLPLWQKKKNLNLITSSHSCWITCLPHLSPFVDQVVNQREWNCLLDIEGKVVNNSLLYWQMTHRSGHCSEISQEDVAIQSADSGRAEMPNEWAIIMAFWLAWKTQLEFCTSPASRSSLWQSFYTTARC